MSQAFIVTFSSYSVIDIYRVEESIAELLISSRAVVIPTPSILCHFNREKFTSIVTMIKMLRRIVQILHPCPIHSN